MPRPLSLPRPRREALLALAAYGAYLAVRRRVLTPAGRARARGNAERVAALERRLGIAVEPRLQEAALGAPRLVPVLNAGYAVGNVTVGIGWLVLLHRSRDLRYRRERRAALAAFLGALPVFLAFPVAPPRHLDGFVDTLAHEGVDLEHPLLVRFYNPDAALPSHHLAFAVVTGAGVAAGARPIARGAIAVGYPAVIALVVVCTGNHFVLDVVTGAALGVAARALTR